MSELSLLGFLDECEREQLHRAQSIQPFGVLLGGTAGDPVIRFVSANLADWTGRAPEDLLGQPLTALLPEFPPPQPDSFPGSPVAGSPPVGPDDWMRPSSERRLYGNLLTGPRGLLDGLLSCNESNWLLELEAALPPAQRHDAYRPVPHRLYRMSYSQDEWEAQCQFLIDELRGLTGFERVMVYRFRPDECGEVIRESLAPGLDPYLGLRYPASDIPRIARTLYLANRHRQIPDIGAAPVPILGQDGALADLSLSDLRAVSPVHLEYLGNMGVTASLSFSLVLFGKLWGLIACHHHSPCCLPLSVRERGAEMARVFTLAIAGYQNNRRLMEVSGSDRDIAHLIESIRRAESLRQDAEELADGRPSSHGPALGRALLSLVGAEGAALIDDQEILTFGVTPTQEQIRAQVVWLHSALGDQIFATDALPDLFQEAADCADRASGLLAVRVGRFDDSGERGERLFLWWRPEQPRTVYWAGDPRKGVQFDPDQQTLSPRSSFERWIETTSGHSEPWSDADLLRAKKFRSLVLRDINAALLRRADPR